MDREIVDLVNRISDDHLRAKILWKFELNSTGAEVRLSLNELEDTDLRDQIIQVMVRRGLMRKTSGGRLTTPREFSELAERLVRGLGPRVK